MQIADLAHFRSPADPTVSPDGRTVVVSVSRVDLEADDYRSDLWVMAVDGSDTPRRLTHGPKDSQPKFSPDGQWLAFVRAEEGAKPQLYVMPVAGGEPRRLTDHPLGARNPEWDPDSRRLAYTARVPEPKRYGTDTDVPPEKEPPRRITSRKYRLDDLGFTRDRRPHIFVVDIAEGSEPRQITDGNWDDASPTWSPDGTTIAFASSRHDTHESDVITDIHLVSAEGGEARAITNATLTASQPVFVDADRVVFLADSHPDLVGRDVQLFLARTDGSAEPQPLTDAEEWHLDSFGTGSSQPLIVDGESIVTLNQRRGSLELIRIPLAGGDPEVVLGGKLQVLSAARAGESWIALIASDTATGEVFRLDGDQRTQLTDFGATLREHATLLPMHELEATAPDGYPVHGWVVKPEGDGPFPVLLAIHGGPFTQYGWAPFDEAQVYASAGYAVVLGNPRGSSGYGEAHGRSIVGDMGNLDRIDLLTLLDHALEDPALDSDRLGVMGGSYGGFMTTWLSGTEDRFRASISERSVNVWDSFIGSSDIGWFFVDSYCGTDPERQRAQSPLTYADGIRNPMLIIHSEEDWRCPVEQAQRLFERLQRNGVESEMLLFPGEGHELSRSGLPSHRVARFEAILDWWQRHLKG